MAKRKYKYMDNIYIPYIIMVYETWHFMIFCKVLKD